MEESFSQWMTPAKQWEFASHWGKGPIIQFGSSFPLALSNLEGKNYTIGYNIFYFFKHVFSSFKMKGFKLLETLPHEGLHIPK